MGQHVNDSECEPENERLLLFFGRIWDYKGLEYLIAAAPLIAKHIPDVQIMIAGQGDDFRKYESLMQNRDQFIVHNQWISDEQRSRFFQRAAVVVLPYTEATQSGVVPVAANYSKPVVATRVGALMECVEHEITGLLVQPRDPEALAEAIVKLLSHPELRHEMGRAAKRKLELESTPAVVAKLTADVYSQAVLPVEV